MRSKDLERIIELSSREVTDEEGLEHFNLKNKLEESLEKGNVQLKCNHSCDCTDCQWGCLRCETNRIVNKAQQETKQLKVDIDVMKNETKRDKQIISELRKTKEDEGEVK